MTTVPENQEEAQVAVLVYAKLNPKGSWQEASELQREWCLGLARTLIPAIKAMGARR